MSDNAKMIFWGIVLLVCLVGGYGKLFMMRKKQKEEEREEYERQMREQSSDMPRNLRFDKQQDVQMNQQDFQMNRQTGQQVDDDFFSAKTELPEKETGSNANLDDDFLL